MPFESRRPAAYCLQVVAGFVVHLVRMDLVCRAGRSDHVAGVLRAERALRVEHEVGALARLERELGRADGTLLRDDLDHAGRSLRAVQRGGGGALDDLDALDLVGVDVTERARVTAGATGGRAERRVVLHAHAVHVDEGLAAQRHRGHASDRDAGATTDLAVGTAEADTRRTGGHELLNARDRGLLRHVRGGEALDGVTEGATLSLPDGTRDDDLLQLQGLLARRCPARPSRQRRP